MSYFSLEIKGHKIQIAIHSFSSEKLHFSCSDLSFCLLFIFYSPRALSCCPVQLERVAAAASQVPRPSTECPGCSHGLGHLWARQSCSCRWHHCHSLWQIWVSLTLHKYLWFYILMSNFLCDSKITKIHLFFFPNLVCSGKGCMTWRFGLVWRGMEGSPLPHQDAPAAVWQRTRWVDLPRYSVFMNQKMAEYWREKRV